MGARRKDPHSHTRTEPGGAVWFSDRKKRVRNFGLLWIRISLSIWSAGMLIVAVLLPITGQWSTEPLRIGITEVVAVTLAVLGLFAVVKLRDIPPISTGDHYCEVGGLVWGPVFRQRLMAYWRATWPFAT